MDCGTDFKLSVVGPIKLAETAITGLCLGVSHRIHSLNLAPARAARRKVIICVENVVWVLMYMSD